MCLYKWIKSFVEELTKLKNNKEVKYVEIDEMRTCVSNKKTINGYGYLFIELEKNTSTSIISQRDINRL